MKRKFLLTALLFLFYYLPVTAQSFAINTDGSTANASALLDVKSTTKGILIPRMTKTQRNSIASPAAGLMVFQNSPDSVGFYYYNGSSWSWISSTSNGSDWKLTGNTATDTANQFIGTTDNMPMKFKVNNQQAGLISNNNTMLGLGAGKTLGTSTGISAIGIGALGLNNNKNDLVAVGDSALYNNSVTATLSTQSVGNSALGYKALYSNSRGSQNTATGYQSLYSNLTGIQNTSNGYQALYNNTTGNNNVAMGLNSFLSNTVGSYNTGIGDSVNVLSNNLTNATAIGAKAAVNCKNCLVLGSIAGINSATANVNVGIGTTSPDALLHVQRGAVLFDSTIGNTPASGAGTRMMWIPAKAAFRAGNVNASQWDDVNIGAYSIALGYNTRASGNTSVALGNSSTASGSSSIAMSFATASGNTAIAMGSSTTASGDNSIALGYDNTASGNASTALGLFLTASGYGSTAIGWNSTAAAYGSTAMGVNSTASGYHASTIGYANNSNGDYATAMGAFTKSKSFRGFTVGTYNDSSNAANSTAVNSLNRIFQIGNGTADNARSNAMTVLQNGNIGIGVLNPKHNLAVAGEICVDYGESNNGDTSKALRFGSYYTGEAIGSKRTTGGNFWGLDFYTDYVNRMVITNGGNVGIGVYSPARRLSVATDIAVDESNTNNGSISGSLHFGASNSGEAIASNRTAGNLFGLDFYTNSANRLSITNAGNVGIGTTAPSVTLDVNGTTTTNGLQVSNGTVFTKMQSGSVTVGPGGTSQLTYTITFPVAFTSATPKVFATARNQPSTSYDDAFSVSVRSVSATAVVLNIQRTDSNGSWAQQLRVDWFAVE